MVGSYEFFLLGNGRVMTMVKDTLGQINLSMIKVIYPSVGARLSKSMSGYLERLFIDQKENAYYW